MGQAKKRGNKEQRIKEAKEFYRQTLIKLSKYGPTTKTLDDYFNGNARAALEVLAQIKAILLQHKNAISVELLMRGGQLNLSVKTDGTERTPGKEERDLEASIKELRKSQDPTFIHHTAMIANCTAEELNETHPYATAFDLELGKSEVFFRQKLAEGMPSMNKDELNFFSKMLSKYSNHPYSADKVQSFIFKQKPTIN